MVAAGLRGRLAAAFGADNVLIWLKLAVDDLGVSPAVETQRDRHRNNSCFIV
jgi:hypothetical protein